MALQKINWTQIDSENVPSGSIIDLGSSSNPLHSVYAENLYISGVSVSSLISNGGSGSGGSGSNGTSGSSGSSGVGSSGTAGSSGTSGQAGTSGTSGSSGSSGIGSSGTSGSSGVGTSGTSGSSGFAGYEGHLAIWKYSGNTNTSLDPGAGYFNLDSAAWGTSTTSITLDNFAYSPNQDFSAYLDGLTIGTILKLVKVGDASTFKLLKIDLVSPFDSGYEKYTVSELSGDGTDPNDNDEFLLIPLGIPGLTGTAGTSGSSGSSGSSGTAGTSGSSGSSGTAGSSGSSGTAGTSGSSGSDGTSGTSGSSGTSGTSGSSGSDGTSGTSGDSIFALTGSNWYTNENVIIDGKLTVNELIVSSSITNMTVQYSSGSTKFGDTSDDTHTFTGSVNISGSIVATGTSLVSGSSQVILSGVTGFSNFSSSISTSLAELTTTLNDSNIWQQTGSYYSANQNIQITGSVGSLMKSPDGATDEKYALAISQSIHANNINVGVPTSNDWGSNLNGSYFNNFNKNTDVSEILRFVAGLLSSSAPDAAPNTKTYSTATKNTVNSTEGSVSTTVPGSVPQSSTNTTITYLNGKGFANTGQPLFSGITVNTNASYGHTFTSVSAGSTNVSSSVDAQLFGLGQLSSGTPTNFRVSGSFIFKFKDSSLKTDTATSSSNHLITQTGAGTTSGVTLAKITTANPAVIPAAYQDGKFVSVFSPTIYNGGLSGISGSGYYNITSSISISSGSATTYTTPVTSDIEVFYAPLSTIATNIPAQTPTFSDVSVNGITAVSRSLSGAPYLSSATYTISGSVLGLFNPLYYAGTGIATITDSDALVTESGGILTVSTAGGTIQTANAVYDSTGVTTRSTGTVPYETDIVKVYTTSSFLPTTSDENINQTGLGTTSFSLQINGLNKAGTTTTNTSTVSYHTAGAFGQPSASGSLAYYGRTQGADTATNGQVSSNSEPFLGENYRIQLSDNVLSFTGTAWDTAFGLYNLGANDLQVKPGHLVKPGGTYKYWLENPSVVSDYKYYIRKVTTNVGVKGSMTLNMGTTLVNWNSTTSNSVSCLILFESTKSGLYTPPRFFDPSNALTNLGTISANTDGTNPFGSSIYVNRCNTSSVSSTTYTIPLISGDGMILNATYTNIYVIVRYKGDPTPITSITTTFS